MKESIRYLDEQYIYWFFSYFEKFIKCEEHRQIIEVVHN